MECPYIIRENIGFGRVREHGYYQLDEMTYDLTHDFKDADVEIVTRPTYNVIMESGERLCQLDDETVFKMLSAELPVKYVENARDRYIMYSRPESEPAVKVKRVSGITRAHKEAKAVKQYDNAVIIPMAKEWVVITRADVDTFPHGTNREELALSWFERSASKMWFQSHFYDEVRLYHNGVIARISVKGHEIDL